MYNRPNRNLVTLPKEIKKYWRSKHWKEPSSVSVTCWEPNWNRNKNTWGTNNNCGVMHVDCAQEIGGAELKNGNQELDSEGIKRQWRKKFDWGEPALLAGTQSTTTIKPIWDQKTLFKKSFLRLSFRRTNWGFWSLNFVFFYFKCGTSLVRLDGFERLLSLRHW